MAENQQQAMIRQQFGLRVGSETAAYLFRQAQREDTGQVTVIATNARTGAPLLTQLPADKLRLLGGQAGSET